MTPKNQLMVEQQAAAVARRISEELSRPGKSVEEMADRAGISVQAVYKWCRTGHISKTNLLRLAEYTGRTPDYFLSGAIHAREPDLQYGKPDVANLTDAIALMEELLPTKKFPKLPPRLRAQLIEKAYSMTLPDGTIRVAEVVELVKPVRAKYGK